MKQNIQKSILLPFIIFTVLLTGLLVTWSGFFIKTFLYQNEVTSLYSQLTNFKTASEQLLASNTLINQLAKNSKDIQYIIASYDNNYPEQSLYNLYKKRESPFQINAKDKHTIVKHNDDNIYLLQDDTNSNNHKRVDTYFKEQL